MKIEIDQSIKIENTSRNTVIADSLGNYICVSAETKRLLQQHFRKINKPKIFVFETFSFLLSYLISLHYKLENIYLIDVEYPGYDNDIKAKMFRYFSRLNCAIHASQVSFGLVGRRSKSHETAYKIATSKIRNKKMLQINKLLHFIT